MLVKDAAVVRGGRRGRDSARVAGRPKGRLSADSARGIRGGSKDHEMDGSTTEHASSSRPDHFPPTLRTWLCGVVGRGDEGIKEAARHVMDVYAWPLSVYFRGSTFRWLGEPDDVVRGFFADRLGREEFFERWLESDRRLRHWLIVAFKHYLFETSRARRRDGRVAGAGALEEPPSGDAHGESLQGFWREIARSVVGRAMDRAEASCAADKLEEHWVVFRRHMVDGASYAEIEKERGIPAARAAVMARTAGNRFRIALREGVAWPGASEGDIDQEIASLMEDLS